MVTPRAHSADVVKMRAHLELGFMIEQSSEVRAANQAAVLAARAGEQEGVDNPASLSESP